MHYCKEWVVRSLQFKRAGGAIHAVLTRAQDPALLGLYRRKQLTLHSSTAPGLLCNMQGSCIATMFGRGRPCCFWHWNIAAAVRGTRPSATFVASYKIFVA